MKKLLIGAVAAPAPAAEPGVLLAQYHDGDAQRHEEWERRNALHTVSQLNAAAPKTWPSLKTR